MSAKEQVLNHVSEAERLFKMDPQSEKDGIWLDYSPTLAVKIRRASRTNKRYRRVLEKHMRPVRKLVDAKQLSDDQGDQILLEIYAESIIIDWKGFTDDDGKEMKPTFANIVSVMTKLPDLFDNIREAASGMELFKAHLDMEVDAGN